MRYLIYAVLAFIVWKIIRLVLSTRRSSGRYQDPPVDMPQDHSYKNIEDADFEDITGDSGKPS